MNHRIPVLLDGDPGHDDAIAWMLAATGLDIRGVSSVAGNQTIEKTTRNALRICTLLGIRAPVAMGLARPLLSEALTAPSVHGVSGLDGPALPEPDREAAPERAPEQMARLLRESAEPLTIVATAPLTNVAALLLAHPELKANIAGISLMGGGLAHGNWTPAAEFNILADPEAADVVFRSGLPITMAGLDVTEQALLYPEDFARIRAVGNPVAETVAGWLDFFFAFHRTRATPERPCTTPWPCAPCCGPICFALRTGTSRWRRRARSAAARPPVTGALRRTPASSRASTARASRNF